MLTNWNPFFLTDNSPPLAWNNRANHRHQHQYQNQYQNHQRHYSASPSQRPVQSYDDSLLKPPPRFGLSHSHYIRATMASAGPVLPTPAGFHLANIPRTFYSSPDEDFITRVERSSARSAAMEHGYAPGETSQPAALSDAAIMADSLTSSSDRTAMYNRPRRLSNSSTATTTSTVYSSPESSDGRIGGGSSWGSQTSFESIISGFQRPVYANPHLQGQNHGQNPAQQYPWQRPALIKAARRRAKPGELFAALPGEVLELILEELKQLHLRPGSASCATCWMRDCCSVALSARKWLKFARTALYEDIQLVGADGTHMKKRYKLGHGARMVLLRRSLRSLPHIAVVVRSLKVPALLPPGTDADGYRDLVASVIMACPNLERLTGFYPAYNHEFSRLFHALSTRQRLREMAWVLEAPPAQPQPQTRTRSKTRIKTRTRQGGEDLVIAPTPAALQPQQSKAFLEHHVNWLHLTTLTVHCQPGAVLGPDSLLTSTLVCLPLLQNLHLSHLPYATFNNASLLSLPPLKKLTLAHLGGVTTAGLSSFATRPNSATVRSLTLIHMDVDSLPALARIFSNFAALESFSIVQRAPPTMAPGEPIWLFPYLASPSLRRLHWDIIDNNHDNDTTTTTNQHPAALVAAASPADVILARSVAAAGFPRLRALRAPNDPEGIFQALCRPRERADLPADRYAIASAGSHHHHPHHPYHVGTPPRRGVRRASTASSSAGAGSVSSGSSGGAGGTDSPGPGPPPGSPGFAQAPAAAAEGVGAGASHLRLARMAAQARVEAGRRAPRFLVNVVDERGMVVERHGIGAFVGCVGSPVEYVLLPDAGGTDEGGGLVGVEQLIGGGGEDGGGMEGCMGRWNTYSSVVVDKKDRERWWHTERGRWRGVALS